MKLTRIQSWAGAGVWIATSMALSAMPTVSEISAEDLAFFEAKVRPVLEDNCYKCHSRDADKIKGGLLLDSREGLMHGGYKGDAVVPGNPAESLMIVAINHADEDMKMPSKRRKLADHEIADLTEWVMRGAPDPRTRADDRSDDHRPRANLRAGTHDRMRDRGRGTDPSAGRDQSFPVSGIA